MLINAAHVLCRSFRDMMAGIKGMKLAEGGTGTAAGAGTGAAASPGTSAAAATPADAGSRLPLMSAAVDAESGGRSSGSEGVVPRPTPHQRSPLGRSVVTALEAQMDQVASSLDVDTADGAAPPESPSRRRSGAYPRQHNMLDSTRSKCVDYGTTWGDRRQASGISLACLRVFPGGVSLHKASESE